MGFRNWFCSKDEQPKQQPNRASHQQIAGTRKPLGVEDKYKCSFCGKDMKVRNYFNFNSKATDKVYYICPDRNLSGDKDHSWNELPWKPEDFIKAYKEHEERIADFKKKYEHAYKESQLLVPIFYEDKNVDTVKIFGKDFTDLPRLFIHSDLYNDDRLKAIEFDHCLNVRRGLILTDFEKGYDKLHDSIGIFIKYNYREYFKVNIYSKKNFLYVDYYNKDGSIDDIAWPITNICQLKVIE